MEKYKIELTKEQICILHNFLESEYNKFCWCYHIAKMSKHKTACDFNFVSMSEVATLMDEVYSQIMIQDGSTDI